MKSLTAQLAAHLAGETTTLATCWKITRRDGLTLGFTDCTHDLVIDGLVHSASTGFAPSAIQTSAQLSVDNLEIVGLLDSPALTEADMMAGLWDFAQVWLFMVNYQDLTQGKLMLRRGNTGELKSGRTAFTAELRGMMQHYQQVIGRIVGFLCTATLGDAKCTVNLQTYAKTGALTSIVNRRRFTDPARNEAQASTSAHIVNITQDNPAQVTLQAGVAWGSGEVIEIDGVTGMTDLNGKQFAITRVTDTVYNIAADTRGSAPYTAVSGYDATKKTYTGTNYNGTATEIVANYWAGGIITFTTGLNAGISREVRAVASSGEISLQTNLPYDPQVGDQYIMTPGCDKFVGTCRSKYNNVINFRGFPSIPGQDRMISGRGHG